MVRPQGTCQQLGTCKCPLGWVLLWFVCVPGSQSDTHNLCALGTELTSKDPQMFSWLAVWLLSHVPGGAWEVGNACSVVHWGCLMSRPPTQQGMLVARPTTAEIHFNRTRLEHTVGNAVPACLPTSLFNEAKVSQRRRRGGLSAPPRALIHIVKLGLHSPNRSLSKGSM